MRPHRTMLVLVNDDHPWVYLIALGWASFVYLVCNAMTILAGILWFPTLGWSWKVVELLITLTPPLRYL